MSPVTGSGYCEIVADNATGVPSSLFLNITAYLRIVIVIVVAGLNVHPVRSAVNETSETANPLIVAGDAPHDTEIPAMFRDEIG
jgi:hypothetical protein